MSISKTTSKHKTLVAVVMGSPSDWPVMRKTVETLHGFGVGCEVRVLSAHRTPDEAARFARDAARRGIRVIVAAAGMAAHLAGVLAAHTTLPVIGVPMKGGTMDGLDALLSTVQMPSGIPVATVALGSAGATNGALLAVQILALADPGLRRKMQAHKRSLKDKVSEGQQMIDRDLAEQQ